MKRPFSFDLRARAATATVALALAAPGAFAQRPATAPAPSTPAKAPSTAAMNADAAKAPAAAPDPLAAMNTISRAEYARARTDALARGGPVIVLYEGDHAILLREGAKGSAREEAKFVPDTDARLKAVAHVPLGIYTTLSAESPGNPLPEARRAELSHYREAVAAGRGAVAGAGFSDATLRRQYEIMDASLAVLDATLRDGRVDRPALDAYARRMGPLVLENVDEAARGQIDGLHALVMKWRGAMTGDEWARLHVVVIGVHMAREGELATQYFLRLLGEPEEGRRVVFAEGLWEEPRALDMLGTHMIDGRVGDAFFGSFLRMHRDVLSDAARSYLDVLGVGPDTGAVPAAKDPRALIESSDLGPRASRPHE